MKNLFVSILVLLFSGNIAVATTIAPQLPKLYVAAETGDVSAVSQLLKDGAAVDETCQFACTGWTPLMIAAANGHAEIVDILLKNNANPNSQNDLGRTALHFAVRYDFFPIVKALLKAGANPNLKSFEGMDDSGNQMVNSPMADALTQKNENTEMLRVLVIEGAGDVNYEFWGRTPIIMAARYNDVELLKYLLEHGADKSYKHLQFGTALDIAREYESKEAMDLLSK